MGRKVVAVFSIVAFLFTMISTAAPNVAKAAESQSITLYDLNTDSGLVGGIMDSTALQKAGNPTINVIKTTTGSSLHLTNVVNSWDGMDLKLTALKQSDGSYLAGDYTFTVTGHVDTGVAASYVDKDGKPATLQMIFGMSADPYNWFANQVIDPKGDGTFTLTYSTTYSSASELASLAYDYRIQKNGDGSTTSPTSFYLDGIKVTVVPGSSQPPTQPEIPDQTLPVGSTVTVYDLDKDTKLTVAGSLTDSPAFAISGDATVSVEKGTDTTTSLYVQGRVNNWDGVDILRTAFKQNEAYYAGNYEITVKAHVDPVNVASSSAFVIGMTQSPWGELSSRKQPASDGTFTLTYSKYYSSATIDKLAYDFRIQTTAKDPASFYVDSITVTVTGTEPKVEIVPKWDLTLPSMADAYKSTFLMGNIMGPEQTTDKELTAMYKKQYNAVTAENAMKPQSLSSAKDVYNYTDADKLVSWAQANGIQVHAHTLVWHSQSADWLTKNSQGPLTREEAKANMQSYINNVAGHFEGKVISWDVVNEAFANDVVTAPTDWKAVLRGASGISDTSPWYAAYANGADANKGESGADFIYDAFVFARLADPAAKLYYNDYNETEVGKREAIAMMVEDLNAKWKANPFNLDKNRLLIEGIGMQAHYWTGELNPKDVEDSILRFIKTGADISVSELDIPVGTYPTYQQNTELTAENEAKQADLYKQLFKIYNKYAKNIDRVTIWGKSDSQSWRWEGYPTLFDSAFAPKDAFYKVMEAAADLVVPTQPGGDNNNQGSNNNQGGAFKPDTSKDATKTVQAVTKSLAEAAKDNKVIAELMKDKAMQGVFASVTEPFTAPKYLTVAVEGAKPGQMVYVYRVNEVTVKLDTVAFGLTYKVDEKGNLSFPILEGGNYVVLTKKAGNRLITALKNQIKVAKKKSLEVGEISVLEITLPASLELTKTLTHETKAEAIGAVTATYAVSNRSIAYIGKNGRILARKAGKVTIITKVSLYNGEVKTFKTVLKIKK